MAEKRETPRQKMIGMMYLVLTALLALQVSSALIYKFQALNTSLEKTVMSIGIDNQEKQSSIALQVKNRGNKPEEIKLNKKAQEIRLKTQEVLSYIEGLKNELIEKSGGYDEEGGFKGAKEETEVEVLMIGANKNSGKAYALKRKLDAYTTYMNAFSKEPFEQLAKNANEDPTLKNNEEQKNKDYAQLTFGQTPMVAALAVLSETSTKIVAMENKVLVGIAREIGIEDYTFDKLKPVVKPQSDFVVAGTNYQAELFMVATSSSIKPQMAVGENALVVNSDGIGALSFMAAGGNYAPDGTIKKTWKGTIKMKKPNGGDTLYSVEHEYTVVKPIIQIRSASVHYLYKNCGNNLSVSVPALGASYNPIFTSEGATIIRGSRPGSITIMPTASRAKLNVNNNGTFIGQEEFGVKLIPLPSIEVKVNNKKIKAIEGTPANLVRTMTIKVIPEKNFQEALPEDAKYFITEGSVLLARGKKVMGKVQLSSYGVNLGPILQEMQSGDRLIVEVKKINRKNFRNEIEEVTFPEYNEIIILN